MRTLFFLCMLLSSTGLFAEQIKFDIQGKVKEPNGSKYAYLYSKGDKDLFMKVPLINGSFKFSSAVDLEKKLLRWGLIFLDARGDIKVEDIEKNLRNKTWVPGGTPKLKVIILEDVDLNILKEQEMNYLTISGKGQLNKQVKELDGNGNAKQLKLAEFIKKYPDSPVGVDYLKSVPKYLKVLPIEKIKEVFGNTPQAILAMLSPRLRNSAEGKSIRADIEKFQKK
ncbi:hypothetical protein [uncultured Pedobacter sp.]|uniref:hypothetical protein n=1 Tax=uncultured Pedobacter sp. TaxID=246139 RepID=UPI0025EC5B7A|nr:hypothetical protein [uncultured Pedobacter sp.]